MLLQGRFISAHPQQEPAHIYTYRGWSNLNTLLEVFNPPPNHSRISLSHSSRSFSSSCSLLATIFMDSTIDKSHYAPIEQEQEQKEADASPPRVQRQSSRQTIRRKVSQAFTSLTRRYSSTSTAASTSSTEDSDNSQPASPAVSPAASRTSTTQYTTIVERERADMSYYSRTYPLVRLDPVLIGCFVCL
ncbi:hypothetical protein PYCCODRAFT_1481636 [Trametes coccinea BRFM310]|uniref:Uncharacterized protein n=1 Tax=Trametes coccinea (strain BRFM310) TaxID=1353009 RepID=A0A1Y2I738_TRAC3|nr:hypothetical protein PYCCODRAFT_1481636 [Trametes coccinea BRFM310]